MIITENSDESGQVSGVRGHHREHRPEGVYQARLASREGLQGDLLGASIKGDDRCPKSGNQN